MNSNWGNSPEMPNLGQNWRYFDPCDLAIWRMILKKIGHLFYATGCFCARTFFQNIGFNMVPSNIEPLYVTSSYSTRIFCRGVSGFATDCPCDVWLKGLRMVTCALWRSEARRVVPWSETLHEPQASAGTSPMHNPKCLWSPQCTGNHS